MPGILMRFTAPDAANIASKLPEPFQKPAGAALQTIFDVVGASDPTSIMPSPAAMVAGGPAAIPAVKAAGRKVIEDVRTLPTLSGFTPDTVSALTVAQSKYPRLFGHIGRIDPDLTSKSSGATFIGLSKPRLELARETGTAARDTIGHELAHVAQKVRNPKDFLGIYKKMDELFGYAKNPFETRARKVGASFADKLDNPLAQELAKRVR